MLRWHHRRQHLREAAILGDLFHDLVTLFVTTDPVGLAPLFVVLTAGATRSERQAIAIRATTVAAAVLVGFALIGEPLLHMFGVSLPAFRIAGGLLLFAIAFEMVFDRRGERKTKSAQDAAGSDSFGHVAVFPLAIPLIAGPASISATVLIASRDHSVAALALLIVAILLIVGLSMLAFLAAGRIERLLGETGRIVVSRLLGLILAALSVQFVADGVMQIVKSAL